MDSGAEFACLLLHVVWNNQFPVEERKIPEVLLEFTDRPVPCIEEPWLEKTSVREDGFLITLSYVKTVDMVADGDLIMKEASVTMYRLNLQSMEGKCYVNLHSTLRKCHQSNSKRTPSENSSQTFPGNHIHIECLLKTYVD